MRVLLLITDLQAGGTPLRVVRWARWLSQAGIEVCVGCLGPRGPLSGRLDELGIRNFACGARSRFDAGALRRLAEVLRRFDPDVLHAFLFHANIAARLVGRLDRRRAIVTSTATVEIERRWHRLVEGLTCGLSDAHVVNAASVARHVIDDLGFATRQVVTLPSGIDMEEIDATPAVDRRAMGIPEGVPLVAWAGRMDPIKRLDIWVRVFDAVRKRSEVCGVLIGDGAKRDEVERDLAVRGLNFSADSGSVGRVRLVGWQERPVSWLKASDVFLLTSDTEGVSNAVQEAMAAGCCVVTSAVGGQVDLVEHERDGLLCGAGDEEQFTGAVMRVCTDARFRAELGGISRKKIMENHDCSKVIRGLIALYRTLAVC